MATEWTTKIKPEVLRQLKNAKIDPKSEAGKIILTLEKSANTVQNLLRNQSMESVVYSKPFHKIEESLNRLNGNGYRVGKEEFSKEWAMFCEVANIAVDAESLDYCA